MTTIIVIGVLSLCLGLPRYMKYLYPYECDRLQLSSPMELQAAVDSNKREGRRQGGACGSYDDLSLASPSFFPSASSAAPSLSDVYSTGRLMGSSTPGTWRLEGGVDMTMVVLLWYIC